MDAASRRAFSPRRQGLETAFWLVLGNVFLGLRYQVRGALYFDLFCVGLFALAFVATRLWPDKVHFRRSGE